MYTRVDFMTGSLLNALFFFFFKFTLLEPVFTGLPDKVTILLVVLDFTVRNCSIVHGTRIPHSSLCVDADTLQMCMKLLLV